MANPKKWGTYLTFGRSPSGSSSRSASRAREAVSRAPSAASTGATLAAAHPSVLKGHARTNSELSEPGQLDKDALVEALQDVAAQDIVPTAADIPAEETQSADVTVTASQSVLPLPPTELPSAQTPTAESVKIVVGDEEKVAESESKEGEEGKVEVDKAEEKDEEPQGPVPPIVKVPVHLPVEGEEETRAAQVFTMTAAGLILAILPPSDPNDETSEPGKPSDLARAAHSFLRSVRKALSEPVDPPSAEHIYLKHDLTLRTLSSSVPGPASPHLFATHMQLSAGTVRETLSRSVTHWLVGERKLHADGAEDVYVEIRKGDMNLSEVDKFVGELVQDLEEGTEE